MCIRRKEKEAVELKFVPYYTWANRGENEDGSLVRIKNCRRKAENFLEKKS